MVKQPRNYLLLGAVLLTVGLIVEFLEDVVIGLNLNVVAKTLVIMFMIAIGFGFAAAIIMPWAKTILVVMMGPFKRMAGNTLGKVLFYVTIYAVLFVLYLMFFLM